MHAFVLAFRSFFLLLYTFVSNVCTFNCNQIVVLHMKCDITSTMHFTIFVHSLYYLIWSDNRFLLFPLVTTPIYVTSGI